MLGKRSQQSRAVAVLLSLLLASGCSTVGLSPGRPGPIERRSITAEEIERTGAWNAWEVLRRAHVPFSFYESRSGEPVHLAQRGRRTAPLLIVDNAPTEGLQLLHHLRASHITSIHVISEIEATHRYGALGAGGAIHIVTNLGLR